MRVALRVLMILFALSWWVAPAMGVIDLTVTWDPEWPVVLEAGWGVLFTGLGLAFLVAGLVPRGAGAALVHAYVVTAALSVAAVAGLEPQTWWIFGMLAIQLPLLRMLARGSLPGPARLHRPTTVVGVVALPFGLAYAWDMAAQNRLGLAQSDLTNDVDHFSVQAALGVTLVLMPLVASALPGSRRLLGTVTALMAGYLGLVSYHWQGHLGGFGPGWSVAVIVWAGAVLVTAWWPTGRRRTTEAAAGMHTRKGSDPLEHVGRPASGG